MTCTCITDIEKKLAETGRNTKLDIPITWDKTGMLKAERVAIKTRKRDEKKREKALSILPSYCPFCGKSYEDEP